MTADPLGIQSALDYAATVAAQLGIPFDPNPLHSTVVQSALHPAPTQAPAPAPLPQPNQLPAGTGSASMNSMMQNPVLFGFTIPEIVLGGGALFIAAKLFKGSKKRR